MTSVDTVSIEIVVIHRQRALPTTVQWGVAIKLDEPVDTATHTGFWPVHVTGKLSGFEYFRWPASNSLDPEQLRGAGDRDTVSAFVTHGDLTELRCAMLTAALARLVDGLSLDYDSGAIIDAATLLEQAHSIPTDQ